MNSIVQWRFRNADVLNYCPLPFNAGRAIAQVIIAGFQPRRPGFKSGSSHVGFAVDKVALGQVRIPLPIFIPTISSQSPSPIIRCWHNSQ
jgi:hypothetical protein